jgi:hypothetical protein
MGMFKSLQVSRRTAETRLMASRLSLPSSRMICTKSTKITFAPFAYIYRAREDICAGFRLEWSQMFMGRSLSANSDRLAKSNPEAFIARTSRNFCAFIRKSRMASLRSSCSFRISSEMQPTPNGQDLASRLQKANEGLQTRPIAGYGRVEPLRGQLIRPRNLLKFAVF